VLATGPPRGGRVEVPVSLHGPFLHPEAAIGRAYLDAGIEYVCSIPMFYDLHLGVARGSPRGPALVRALLDYAAEGGGYALRPLIVLYGREEVAFPLHEPLDPAAREVRDALPAQPRARGSRRLARP
jgi:hypothetical protein